ncbi:MAG TPA: hypothetical protein PKA06_07445, partial [Gemmatales bacterium]|nr:hypothetical protein [Gemmatales bacterium]
LDTWTPSNNAITPLIDGEKLRSICSGSKVEHTRHHFNPSRLKFSSEWHGWSLLWYRLSA